MGRPKGFVGGQQTMAQLHGIISRLTGSAGSLTFKRVGGKTIVSEKITTTTNTRTTAQQKHRMKWANLIKLYSGVAPLLNVAFERKPQGLSDYNMFVKTNFKGNTVYLTKDEVAGNACVAAPYQITMGSLESIQVTGAPGASQTNIAVGQLTLSDTTTVKEFSNAVVANNADYDYGDQIAFIRIVQEKNAVTGYPQCKFYGESIVLDKSSETVLRSIVSASGFSVGNNMVACALDPDFQGAYAWVHSRKESGATLVSTQILTMKNDIYAEYSDEAAYKRAVETYGGENDNFLTPVENVAAADNTNVGG